MKTQILKLNRVARCAVAACALYGTSAQVSALVIGSYVDHGDGTVTYSYKLDNSGGSFDIAAWSLQFGFSDPDWNSLDTFSGGDVSVPDANWFATGGLSGGSFLQDFLTLDSAAEVLSGQQLEGFSFTSRLHPGVVAFTEFSAGGAFATGITVGPVQNAVPDGGSGMIAVAGAALAVFAGVTRRTNA
jgi:hypothetical protein